MKKWNKPLDIFLKNIYNSYVVKVFCRYGRDGGRKQVRLAQLDRAFGYGPKGRGFESSSAR